MDFGIFASAYSGAGAGAVTPDKIQSVLLFLKTLNPFQVSKCHLREIGHTQLHRLGGPSLLRPGLTDTDSESPVFQIARQTQSCFAGVLPQAACTSLPFDFCRLTIDYLRD